MATGYIYIYWKLDRTPFKLLANMTSIAFSSLSRTSVRSPLVSGAQNIASQAMGRWIHQSSTRQAILMPAMSPFMTEGTVMRWKKKEGESFAVGDVLLQIESDIAIIDVEAQNPGILGKILAPDGTTNIPVEQVIALVIKDTQELATSSKNIPVPPPYNPITSPTTSRSITSPLHVERFGQSLVAPSIRSPSLFEKQTMGHNPLHANARGMVTKHSRGQHLTIVPPSPQIDLQIPSPASIFSSKVHTLYPKTAPGAVCMEEKIPDGAAIRRMIVSNLSRTPVSGMSRRDLGETGDYLDALI